MPCALERRTRDEAAVLRQLTSPPLRPRAHCLTESSAPPPAAAGAGQTAATLAGGRGKHAAGGGAAAAPAPAPAHSWQRAACGRGAGPAAAAAAAVERGGGRNAGRGGASYAGAGALAGGGSTGGGEWIGRDKPELEVGIGTSRARRSEGRVSGEASVSVQSRAPSLTPHPPCPQPPSCRSHDVPSDAGGG